ncbi:RES family NAD+ phosphorylase [Rhodopila sp.]|uniref:RES family NAD+ phosphorylase n=1 Tax=Rhodopila sp. TaxID=2480087 RepID=UPI003D0E9B33
MTPLPAPLGSGPLTAWRLDDARHAESWNSGEGAFRVGGRWNSKGTRAVYCSVDPSTAILEVAVHKGFRTLDTVPHVLTSLTIADPNSVHVVDPARVPNPNWLQSGIPGAGQQAFGTALLARHVIILMPSAVSTLSWNLIFDGVSAEGWYALASQNAFALDTRLHPPS